MRQKIEDIADKLKDTPFSYGRISHFEDRNRIPRNYGLIIGHGSECFFHENNFLPRENIKDGDFVLYKTFTDSERKRDTAYLIRHPKPEDGYIFIFNYFFVRKDYIDFPSFINALIPYSSEHWSLATGYNQILEDAKTYLISCNTFSSSYIKLYEAIVQIKSLKQKDNISSDFIVSLSRIIFPDIEKTQLVPIFNSLRKIAGNELFDSIENLEGRTAKRLAKEAFYTENYRQDIEFLLQQETQRTHQKTCNWLRNYYKIKYPKISNKDRVWSYVIGYDNQRSDLLDDDIIDNLKGSDAIVISRFYKNHHNEKSLAVKACCIKIREAWGEKASELMNIWRNETPEMVNAFLQLLKQNIDDVYIDLWVRGIVELSMEDWLTFLNRDEEAIDRLNILYRAGKISQSEIEIIVQKWYDENKSSTEDNRRERFAYDHLFYRKFKSIEVSFALPKFESQYLPLIKWYENTIANPFECRPIDFSILFEHFYLFSDEEQVRILRYWFWQIENGWADNNLNNLKMLTSKAQKEQNNDATIYVCFAVELVIEALIAFQTTGWFYTEKKILELFLNTYRDTDFKLQEEQPLINQLFDVCVGRTWKGWRNKTNRYGHPTDEMILIEKVYERPRGIIFCEGREIPKSNDGLIKYLCRNSYCFNTLIKPHTNWEEYTMFDFCRILGYDLKDGSCENGKYLKFVTLINRFNQFAPHLSCRECDKLMRPSSGITNFGATISTHYECYNISCGSRGKRIYLSHCLNPNCPEPIDSRDSAKCPNGWIICGTCGTCCSRAVYKRRYELLQANQPSAITQSLKDAINNNLGHKEKLEYYCPKCGMLLVPFDGGNKDFNYVCNNDNCGGLFKFE